MVDNKKSIFEYWHRRIDERDFDDTPHQEYTTARKREEEDE